MVEDSLEGGQRVSRWYTNRSHAASIPDMFLGLKYKNPLYLPFATNQMTRSIYCLSPRYKRGGKLTKACTEILFPELAFIKTQNGVPTIRKTMLRLPLFMPEYISVL